MRPLPAVTLVVSPVVAVPEDAEGEAAATTEVVLLVVVVSAAGAP